MVARAKNLPQKVTCSDCGDEYAIANWDCPGCGCPNPAPEAANELDESESGKVPPDYRGLLKFLAHLLVFGVLVDYLLVRGCKSPSIEYSTSPSLSEALPFITHAEPHLRLVSSHWYVNHGFEAVEGRVENVSNTPVNNVIAVASFFDARGVHLADHAARLHYSSLEKHSTFSIKAPHDPRMHTAQLTFRFLAGGAVITDPAPGVSGVSPSPSLQRATPW